MAEPLSPMFPQRDTPTTRVISLDMLRGLMALAVCVYHLSGWTHLFGTGSVGGSLVTLLGVYSVEGFFIISGFCFFHQYQGQTLGWPELKRFHLRRFLRLAPLYYLAMLLNALLDQDVGPSFMWRKLFENLTLTFGLFHPNHAMVLGGWSVGIEYVFYLAFPLLLLLSRRTSILLVSALALSLAAIPWTFGKVEAAVDWGRFHAYVQVPNHAFLFLWGALIADLRRRVSLRISPALSCALLAALVVMLIPAQPIIVDHVEAMIGFVRVKYVLVTGLVVLLFAFTRLHAERPVGRALSWLGDVSYSLYLLHPFAWLAVQTLPLTRTASAQGFLCGVAIALGMAALSYRFIERPIARWARRAAWPRLPATPPDIYSPSGVG